MCKQCMVIYMCGAMVCRITRRKAFAMKERFEANSCVQGFHIYQDRWISVIGERLEWRRESAIMVVTSLLASSMVLWFTVLFKEPPESGSGKSLEFLLHALKYFRPCDPSFLNFIKMKMFHWKSAVFTN